jgi:hypothetical protein
MRSLLFASLMAAALLLSGCGNSNKSKSPTAAAPTTAARTPVATSATPAAPVATSSPAASVAATPSAITTTPATPPKATASPAAVGTATAAVSPVAGAGTTGVACETGQLQLANYDGMGLRGAPIKSMQFSLSNASAKPCDAGPYEVQLLDGANNPLPTRTIHGSTDSGFNQFAYTFALPSGAQLSFAFEWNSVPLAGQPCPAASSLRLTLGQSTTSLLLPLPTGSVAPCDGGTLTLSPLLPGRGVVVPPGIPSPPPPLAGPDRCHTPQLYISPIGGEAAAGTQHTTFALTNVWATACTLYGYVGGQMLDAQGAPLPTNVVRGQGTASINDAPQHFTLFPGASATFVAEWSDVPHGNETSCPIAARLEVTPPDETTFQVVPLPARGFAPCNAGTLHVSPVRPPQ